VGNLFAIEQHVYHISNKPTATSTHQHNSTSIKSLPIIVTWSFNKTSTNRRFDFAAAHQNTSNTIS
jgi:hypothetical protein